MSHFFLILFFLILGCTEKNPLSPQDPIRNFIKNAEEKSYFDIEEKSDSSQTDNTVVFLPEDFEVSPPIPLPEDLIILQKNLRMLKKRFAELTSPNSRPSCFDAAKLSKAKSIFYKLQENFTRLAKHEAGDLLPEIEKQIEQDSQNILNLLSYCRIKTIAQQEAFLGPLTDSELHRDDKILGHIVGDSFISGTGLEGFPLGGMLYQRDILTHRIHNIYKKQKFITADILLLANKTSNISFIEDPTEELNREMLKVSNIALEISNAYTFEIFYDQIKKNVNESLLKEGDIFYFQRGWKGHAIVYQIRKGYDDTFDFRVVNSGLGSSVPGTYEGLTSRIKPFVEVTQISKERLLSFGVWRHIFDIKNLELETPIDTVYGGIIASLGGKLTTEHITFENTFDPQISGTCSYASLPLAQHSWIKDRRFNNLYELMIKLSFLEFYFSAHSLRIQKFSHARILAEKALVFLLEEADRVRNKKDSYIDPGVDLYLAEFALKAQRQIAEAKNYAISSIDNDKTVSNTVSHSAEVERKNTSKLKDPINEQLTKELFTEELQSEKADEDEWIKWNFRAADFLNDLERFSTSMFALRNGSIDPNLITKDNNPIEQRMRILGLGPLLVKKISRFIAKLPLDQDHYPLTSLTIDDFSRLFDHLRKIDELYVYALLHKIERHKDYVGIKPEDYIVTFKIHTILDLFLRFYVQKNPVWRDFYDRYNLYPKVFDQLLDPHAQTTPFWSANPLFLSQYFEIQKYWKQRHPLNEGKAETKDIDTDTKSFIDEDFYHTYYYSQFTRALYPTLHDFQLDKERIKERDTEKRATPPYKGWPDIDWKLTVWERAGFFDSSSITRKLATAYSKNIDTANTANAIAYNALFSITFLSQYLLFSIPEINENYVSFNLLKDREKERFFLMLNLKKLSPSRLDFDEGSILSNSSGDKVSSPFMNFRAANPLGRQIRTPIKLDRTYILRGEKELEKRSIQDSFDEVTELPETSSGLTLQQFRSILHMSGQPDAQVLETLSFFQENPSYLKEKPYQVMLSELLLATSPLEKEVTRHPEIISKLAEFCTTAIRVAQSSSDYSTLRFFLIFNTKVQLLMSFFKPNHGVLYPDSRKIALESLQILTETDKKEKNLMHAVILHHYQFFSPTKKEDWIEIFGALLYRKLNPLKSSDNTAELQNEVENIGYELQDRAHYFFAESIDEKNKILNHALGIAFSGSYELSWNPIKEGSKSFTAKDSAHNIYVYDPFSAYFTINSITQADLSIEHRNILTNFTTVDTNVPYRQIGLFYEFKGEDGFYYRVGTIKKDEERRDHIIQKRFVNEWFELDSPIPFERITSDFSLFFENNNWVSTGIFDDRKPLLMPFDGFRPSDEHHHILLSEDKISKQVISAATIQAADRKIVEVRKIENQRKTHLIRGELANYLSDSGLASLIRLEHPSFIRIWIDEASKKLIKIELPRLNLSFEKNAEALWVCPELTYATISSEQKIEFSELKNHLVLETSSERIAIFPVRKSKKISEDFNSEIGTLSLDLDPDFELDKTERKSVSYVKLELGSDGELYGQNNLERYFLSQLYMRMAEYDKAEENLVNYQSQLGPLSGEENKVLENIILYPAEEPRAVALRMVALFIYVRNQQDYPFLRKENLDKHKVKELYEAYFKHRERISDKWLSRNNPLVLYSLLNFYLDSVDVLQYSGQLKSPMRKKVKNMLNGIYEVEISRGKTYKKEIFHPIVDESSDEECFKNKEYNSEGYRESKLLCGFNKLYDEMLQLHRNELNKTQLIALLTRFYKTVDPANWNTLTEEELKNEILTFLNLRSNMSNYDDISDRAKLLLAGATDGLDVRDGSLSEGDSIKYGPDYSYPIRALPSGNIERRKKEQQLPTFSIALKHDLEWESCALLKPIISEEEIKNTFNPEPLSEDEKTQQHLKFSSLDHIFDKNIPHNELIHYSFEKTRHQIKSYAEKYMQSSLKFSIRPDHLQTMQSKVTPLVEEKGRFKSRLKQEILHLAKKLPEDEIARAQRTIGIISGIDEDIDFTDILHLFARKDAVEVLRKNNALNQEEIQLIFQKIFDYLQVATCQQQLVRVDKNLKELNRFLQEERSSEKITQIKAKASYDLLMATRHYDPFEHPEYLVFEYQRNLLIHKDQIEALEFFIKQPRSPQEKRGGVYEAIMGSGKSYLLAPLLSFLRTKNLSIVIVPKPLLPSTAQTMNTSINLTFGSSVQVLDIQRRPVRSEEQYKSLVKEMTYLTKRLMEIKKNKQIIVISDASIQSLFLMYIETFGEKIKQLDQPNYHLYTLFKKIIFALQDGAFALMDEVDWILHALHAHRFSVGEKEKIHPDTIKSVIALYHLILKDNDLKKLMHLSFIDGSSGPEFSPQYYQNVYLPALIDKIAGDDFKDSFIFSSALMKEEMAGFSERIRTFLGYTNQEDVRRFLNSLENENIKNIFAVLYSEVHQVLPLTLSKVYGVTYGLFPQDENRKKEFAIPYVDGRPQLLSRFGNELEALNYTIQSQLESKDIEELLYRELLRLQKSYLNTNEEKKREFLRKRFSEVFPGPSVLQLLSFNRRHMAEYIANGNSNLLLKLSLIGLHALKDIDVYAEQLNTNAFIFEDLFAHVDGMSGTLWNTDSYPNLFQAIHLSDALPNTLSLLWEKSASEQEILSFSSQLSQSEKINKIICCGATAIIDAAGSFRDSSNEEIAKLLLAKSQRHDAHLDRIIYYDAFDKPQILFNGGEIKEYSALSNDRAKTVAYWDLQHTTGSDLKVNPKTKAVVTVGKQSIMRDILQAVWRLRELHMTQSVYFAVSEEDSKFMLDALNTTLGKTFDILSQDHLLLFLMLSEIQVKGQHNYRAFKSELNHHLIRKALFNMKQANSFVAARGVYHDNKSLFVDKEPEKPSDRYGFVNVLKDKETVVDSYISSLENSLIYRRLNDQTLAEKFRETKVNKQPLLPHMLETNLSDNRLNESVQVETQVETQTESELELSMELMTSVAVELSEGDVSREAAKRYPLSEDKVLDGSYFTTPLPFSTLSSPVVSVEDFPSFWNPVNTSLAVKNFLWHEIFSPKLGISINAAPVYSLQSKPRFNFKFFSTAQKIWTYALVIKEFDSDKVDQMILLDREEAMQLRDIFYRDSISPEGIFMEDVKRPMFLVHLSSGVFSKNKAAMNRDFDIASFMRRKETQYIMLLSQAKFISGALSYREEEFNALKEWISNSGLNVVDLRNYVIKTMLKYKQDSLAHFPGSDLDRLLRTY